MTTFKWCHGLKHTKYRISTRFRVSIVTTFMCVPPHSSPDEMLLCFCVDGSPWNLDAAAKREPSPSRAPLRRAPAAPADPPGALPRRVAPPCLLHESSVRRIGACTVGCACACSRTRHASAWHARRQTKRGLPGYPIMCSRASTPGRCSGRCDCAPAAVPAHHYQSGGSVLAAALASDCARALTLAFARAQHKPNASV